MQVIKDKVIFSSGRSQYTHGDGFSVGSDLETVCYGSDGSLHWSFTPDHYELHPEDMIELADYMIERWKLFKAIVEAEL